MKIVRFILCAILVFTIIFSAFFAKNILDSENIIKETPNYKCIINVWQIDGIEGGKGSRKKFLESVSKTIEKQNKGVLFLITNKTIDSANREIQSGNLPDIISFCNGVYPINIKEISSERKLGMGFEDKYILPWCKGGYALIYKDGINEKINSVVISKSEYTLPLCALILNDKQYANYSVKKPLEAYIDFINGKDKCLLGTQRDIVRLNNKGISFSVVPLDNFCDLYQYISILTDEKVKAYYSKIFVDYLLSNEVQDRLNEICMFSPYKKIEYLDENLDKLQNANINMVVSPLLSKDKILEIDDICNSFYKTEDQSLSKIKNLLISLEK